MARRTIGEGEISMDGELSIDVLVDEDKLEEAERKLKRFQERYSTMSFVSDLDEFEKDLIDVQDILSKFGEYIEDIDRFKESFWNLSAVVKESEANLSKLESGLDGIFDSMANGFRVMSASANGDIDNLVDSIEDGANRLMGIANGYGQVSLEDIIIGSGNTEALRSFVIEAKNLDKALGALRETSDRMRESGGSAAAMFGDSFNGSMTTVEFMDSVVYSYQDVDKLLKIIPTDADMSAEELMKVKGILEEIRATRTSIGRDARNTDAAIGRYIGGDTSALDEMREEIASRKSELTDLKSLIENNYRSLDSEYYYSQIEKIDAVLEKYDELESKLNSAGGSRGNGGGIGGISAPPDWLQQILDAIGKVEAGTIGISDSLKTLNESSAAIGPKLTEGFTEATKSAISFKDVLDKILEKTTKISERKGSLKVADKASVMGTSDTKEQNLIQKCTDTYLVSLKAVDNEITRITNAQRSYSAAMKDSGDAKSAYSNLGAAIDMLKELRNNLESGEVSMDRFNTEMRIIAQSFAETRKIVTEGDLAHKAAAIIEDDSKKQFQLLNNIDAIRKKIATASAWTVSKEGASGVEYSHIQEQTLELDKLEASIRKASSAEIELKDVEDKLAKVSYEVSHAMSQIKDIGENRSFEPLGEDADTKLDKEKTTLETIVDLLKKVHRMKLWTSASDGSSPDALQAYRSVIENGRELEDLFGKINGGIGLTDEDVARVDELADNIRNASDVMIAFGKNKAANNISSDTLILNESIRKTGTSVKGLKSEFDSIPRDVFANVDEKQKAKFDAISASMGKLGISVEDTAMWYDRLGEQIQQLEQQYYAMRAGETQQSEEEIENLRIKIKERRTLVESIKKYIKEINRANKADNAAVSGSRIVSMRSQISDYIRKNPRAYTQYQQRFDELLGQTNVKEMTAKGLEDIRLAFRNVSLEAKNAGYEGKTFFEILRDGWKKFGGWTIITRSFTTAIRYLKQMVTNVVEVDTAMVELRKVTDATEAEYIRFLERSKKTALELGSSLTDVISATSNFSRLGFSIEDSEDLARIATIYANVGDDIEDIDQATSSLISTMQAFGYNVNESERIVDKFNKIGNEFPISSGGIGIALQDSAAALHSAGNDIDESIALIAAANRVVQDPQKLGAGWRTIALRIRGAKTELEDLGEETDDMAESTSKLRDKVKAITNIDGKGGIDIIDPNTGGFRSTYEIVVDIAKIWDQLGKSDPIGQAALLELLAGKNRSNILAATLGNLKDLEEVLDTSKFESAGSAAKEYSVFLESIQSRINKLKTAFINLSLTIVDSDLVKGAADFGIGAIKFVDELIKSFGGLHSILLLIGGFFTAKNFASIALTATTTFKSLKNVIPSVLLSFQNMGSIIGGVTSETISLGTAMKLLTPAIGAVTVAIGLLVLGINAYRKHQEDVRKETEENAKKAADEVKSISDLANAYLDYSQKLESGENVQDDYAKAKDDLIDKLKIEQEELDALIAKYGDYDKAIASVTANDINGTLVDLEKEVFAKAKDLTRKTGAVYGPFDIPNAASAASKGADFAAALGILQYDDRISDSLLNTGNSIYQKYVDAVTSKDADSLVSVYAELENFRAEISKAVGVENNAFKDIDAFFGMFGDSVSKYTDAVREYQSALTEAAYYESVSEFGKPTKDNINKIKSAMHKIVWDGGNNGIGFNDADKLVDDYVQRFEDGFAEIDAEVEEHARKVSDSLSSYKNAVDVISAALTEYNANGEVTVDTYKRVSELSDDAKDIFEMSADGIKISKDALEKYTKALQDETAAKMLEGDATEEDIKSMYSYASVLAAVAEQSTASVDDIKALGNVLAKVREGEALSASEIEKLIKDYPELASAVYQTVDGYSVEMGAVENLIEVKKKLVKQNLQLLDSMIAVSKAQVELAMSGKSENVFFRMTDRIFSQFGDRISNFDDYEQYVKAMEGISGVNWKDEQRQYVQALILQKEMESKYNKLIDDFGKNGDGKTTSSSSKSDEPAWLTRFKESVEEQKHLVAMGKKTEEEYIRWLDGAYQAAFANDTNGKYKSDRMKYEEEVYAGLKDLREKYFDEYLKDAKFAIEVLEADGKSQTVVMNSWQKILSKINAEIAYYESIGYDNTSDIIQKLRKEAWDAKDNIVAAIRATVDEANDVLDGFKGFYDTITSAASEYAKNGFLSVDSLQSILELSPKYLSFLQNENGQLVLNEDRIRAVVDARTKDLAAETALAYTKEVLLAAQDKDVRKLRELVDVTYDASTATFGLAYQVLQQAKAVGKANGMQEKYFDEALDHLNDIQYLAISASNSMGAYFKSLKDGYVSQADGLDYIISKTQELIKWENENQIEALEKEKDSYADIIEQKKKMLDLTKEQEDHEKDMADKIAEVAKLQSRIDQLSLDDSREATAQRKRLEEELFEKQKDLTESQNQYSHDQQVKALDDELDAYNNEKDDEIDKLKNSLSSAEKLYQAAINRIVTSWDGNWSSLYGDMIQWNELVGSSLNRDITANWDAATAAVTRYGSVVAALDGVKNDTIIGDGNHAKAVSYVDEMKANSAAWFTASDARKQELADRNVEIATILEKLLGEKLTRGKDGVWMLGNRRLYDIYHTGGIVGGEDVTGKDETFALLKNGEMVLNHDQQKNLFGIIDIFKYMSEKLGTVINKSALSSIIPSVRSAVSGAGIESFRDIAPNISTFAPNVSVSISHSGSMSESDARRYGEIAADSALGKLKEAFVQRGF